MKDCNSCGKCCVKYGSNGLSASKQEINNWQEDALEIAEYVHNGEIWFDPINKQPVSVCPFLQQSPNGQAYTCAIYYNRPDDCRYYPSTFEEMVIDGCEMVEAKDLKDPKKSQQALDIIMSDSRY